MNKNIVIAILIFSVAINLMLVWPTNQRLVHQAKNFIQSIIYKSTIQTMFEENMKMINEILAICEKNNRTDITDEELNYAASEIANNTWLYNAMFDKKFANNKYAHLSEQRLPMDNKFGIDWWDTPITQWMQLIYVLRTKQAENPQAKIYPLAETIILNTMPIETRKLHEHIAAMRWLDAQKTEKK